MEKQRLVAIERGETPKALDKEYLRDWGRTVNHPSGCNLPNLDPEDPEHLAFMDTPQVLNAVCANTGDRYRQALQMLTRFRFGAFQEQFLH